MRHVRINPPAILADDIPTAADETDGPLVCHCDDPDPDAIGECSHCRRLVASTVRWWQG